jgi:hypothetical protein
MPPGVGVKPFLPRRKAVQFVDAANCVQSVAATVTGSANRPIVASLHHKQLIAYFASWTGPPRNVRAAVCPRRGPGFIWSV